MPYSPRYTWRQTKLDERDTATKYDWCGYDGDQYIGRIWKEFGGPMKGKWHWAGSYPKALKGAPPTPNAGFVDSARLATKMVEEYWDRCFEVMKG
jgi:hypothetical protein